MLKYISQDPQAPQIVWLFRRLYYMWTRLYGGKTPQTPLSVLYVGFAHDGGIPPTPPQIGGGPPNPPNCMVVKDDVLYVGTTICSLKGERSMVGVSTGFINYSPNISSTI